MFITLGCTSFPIITLGWGSAYSKLFLTTPGEAEERTPGLQAGGWYLDWAVTVCYVYLWTQGYRKVSSAGIVQKP